jgi:cyanophycinase
VSVGGTRMISMALLGAGEFDPWSDAVDRWALARAGAAPAAGGVRDGRVVILPTASAPEGDEIFDGWAAKGLEHYGRLRIPSEVLVLKTREDAQNGELIERLRGASVVYFSGGNPYYLARTLRETAFWRAIVEELDRGSVYVGCSAGVAALTETTYDASVGDVRSPEVWKPGLGFVRGVLFAPHWNTVDRWFPGATEYIASSVRPGDALVAQDEDTAMIGDGTEWSVVGEGGIHVLRGGEWAHHAGGGTFTLALELER